MISEFKEQAFEYFESEFQSSQENIKELFFDQFGLTDEKMSEYAKITNEKLDKISGPNKNMIQQFCTKKKFVASVSNVSDEKSSNVKSVPTSSKNEQSSQQPHVENVEMVEQTGKPGTLSYKQEADVENGGFLSEDLAKPLDNNDFNGEGPIKQVNINIKNEATSYLY